LPELRGPGWRKAPIAGHQAKKRASVCNHFANDAGTPFAIVRPPLREDVVGHVIGLFLEGGKAIDFCKVWLLYTSPRATAHAIYAKIG
jgi:hypothetical protein